SLAANPTAAPGLPMPNEASKKPQLLLDLGPFESLVAVSMTLMLIVGVIIGGYYAYHALVPPAPPEQATAMIANETAMESARRLQKVMDSGPLTVPPLPPPPADLEAKTQALTGYWVSRADDGSVATLDLRKDGVAICKGALEPEDAHGLQGRWELMRQDKNIA